MQRIYRNWVNDDDSHEIPLSLLVDTNGECWSASQVMLSTRAFHLTALVLGLIAAGALTIAIVTDYWIFTSEPIKIVAEGLWEMMVVVKTHSGLWRSCTYNDGLPGELYSTTLPFAYHDDVSKWKLIPRYWPFVRGIHRTKASDAELWCFLWSAPV